MIQYCHSAKNDIKKRNKPISEVWSPHIRSIADVFESMNPASSPFFHIEGPLPADCPSYVERPCDEQVFQKLRRTESCWVFGSPHTGKSSLGVRMAHRLREQDFEVAVLRLGVSNLTQSAELLYESLLKQLLAQLQTENECNSSLSDSVDKTPADRFFATVCEIASNENRGSLIVVLDDIHCFRELAFPITAFLESLQSVTSLSPGSRERRRLAFLFLGTAHISELAPEASASNFNLGEPVELTDFTPDEASALESELVNSKQGSEFQNSASSLARILHWTNGHPYLTQKLCLGLSQFIVSHGGASTHKIDDHSVDRLCEDLLLSNRARDRDNHLNAVRHCLKRKNINLADVLSLLIRIRNREIVNSEKSQRPLIVLLESGIVQSSQGSIQIRNRIYERVFDLDWAMARLPILRDSAPTSVAIMPFRDDAADPLDEYWADGLTEELINALGQIPGLSIAAPGSVFQFKGKQENLLELATKLRAEVVLNGIVRRREESLRIFVELVSTKNGYRLWSDSFLCRTKDVLEIQETITSAVAERLQIHWQSQEKRRASGPPTENLEAYNLYLKGRFLWNKRQEESVKQSIGLFQDAIGLDPQFALAFAGLADAYNILGTYNYVPPAQAYPRGKVAALKALEIDERLAPTHAAFGCVSAIYDWDWTGAEEAFKCAIDLNPSYAPARQWYAVNCLTPLGRHEESLNELRKAQAVDPLSLGVQASVALAYYYAHDYEKAIEQCRFTLEMEERFWVIHMFAAWAHLQMGNLGEALAASERACNLGKTDPVALAAFGHAHALAGDHAKGLAVLTELTELAKNRYVPSGELAFLCIGLGNIEQAFGWLGKAEEEKALRLIYLKVEPRFDAIRSDPRFQDLLRKVGLAG